MNRYSAFLLTYLFCASCCFGQNSSKVADNLAGEWTGQLEYRDFSNDSRVRLPTWLKVTRVNTAIQFDYVYDDGPGKVVKESSLLTLDLARKTATLNSLREGSPKSEDVYRVEGLEKLNETGRGVILLTGTGTENGQAVDVRITLTLGRNIYRLEKETRAANNPFQFRDAYTFTRRQPPL